MLPLCADHGTVTDKSPVRSGKALGIRGHHGARGVETAVQVFLRPPGATCQGWMGSPGLSGSFLPPPMCRLPGARTQNPVSSVCCVATVATGSTR